MSSGEALPSQPAAPLLSSCPDPPGAMAIRTWASKLAAKLQLR